jgi:hypothetical protein
MGWDGPIKAIMNAQCMTPRGVHPAEFAVPGPFYAAELRKRGFHLTDNGECPLSPATNDNDGGVNSV